MAATTTYLESHNRMSIRKVPFIYPAVSTAAASTAAASTAHWNKDKPEFSQLVNAASLAMPYLEPYLVKVMRQARPAIKDPALQEDLDLQLERIFLHLSYKEQRDYLKLISKLELRIDKKEGQDSHLI